VGRLPAVFGGGPTVPKKEQAGKATGPTGIAGLPKEKKFYMGPVVYIDHGLFYSAEKVDRL
jgi:hypothetical protein